MATVAELLEMAGGPVAVIDMGGSIDEESWAEWEEDVAETVAGARVEEVAPPVDQVLTLDGLTLGTAGQVLAQPILWGALIGAGVAALLRAAQLLGKSAWVKAFGPSGAWMFRFLQLVGAGHGLSTILEMMGLWEMYAKERTWAVYFGKRLLGLMSEEGYEMLRKTAKREVRRHLRALVSE